MVTKKVYVAFPSDTSYDGCILIAADSLDEAKEMANDKNKIVYDCLISTLELVEGMTYEGDESMILVNGIYRK